MRRLHDRWWVLICCCVMSFATSFVLDQPSVLVQRLTGTAEACEEGSRCLYFTVLEFNMVQSVYAWASAATAFVVGMITDRYGCTFMLLASSVLMFVGPFLVAAATTIQEFSGAFALMIIGRILTGFGSGTVVVISHRVKSDVFMYKELGLAFAVHLVFDRLGSALCYIITGGLINQLQLTGSLWLGFGITVFASAASLVLAYYEKRNAVVPDTEDTTTASVSDDFRKIGRFFTHADKILWLFAVIIFFEIGAGATFVANGPYFIAVNYAYGEQASSYITGIIYDVTLLAPLIGYLTDRFGRREWWITAGTWLLALNLLALLVVPSYPIILFVVIFGLSGICFLPVLWSSIGLLVDHESIGLAFGLMTLTNNFGVGTFAALAGVILEIPRNSAIRPWDAFILFLLSAAALGALLSLGVYWLNWKAGGLLSPNQAERERRNVSKIVEVTEVTALISRPSVTKLSATGSI